MTLGSSGKIALEGKPVATWAGAQPCLPAGPSLLSGRSAQGGSGASSCLGSSLTPSFLLWLPSNTKAVCACELERPFWPSLLLPLPHPLPPLSIVYLRDSTWNALAGAELCRKEPSPEVTQNGPDSREPMAADCPGQVQRSPHLARWAGAPPFLDLDPDRPSWMSPCGSGLGALEPVPGRRQG